MLTINVLFILGNGVKYSVNPFLIET